ncbi:VOC family protein [Nocardia mexicana]|uniref:Glyoxalase/bleomycin resistance protein/dioxygenase superfamily protein n=1 Tax=Nocardia mexicana TaxID=279262 RepID=A0A370GKW4_9NOCA|nr:VOC family protein [Nocardia mexicana]RDI44412.1 glyoxalase/bleomycin resistance protein/dioxygenase superfamily protein [Nocardia mexicana]
MFGTLSVVTIQVKDLDAMTAFYRDVMQMRVMKSGPTFTSFHTGNGGELVLWKDAPVRMLPNFAGADLEAARVALRDAGVTEILDHPGGKHIFAYDPDGNTIGLSDA